MIRHPAGNRVAGTHRRVGQPGNRTMDRACSCTSWSIISRASSTSHKVVFRSACPSACWIAGSLAPSWTICVAKVRRSVWTEAAATPASAKSFTTTSWIARSPIGRPHIPGDLERFARLPVAGDGALLAPLALDVDRPDRARLCLAVLGWTILGGMRGDGEIRGNALAVDHNREVRARFDFETGEKRSWNERVETPLKSRPQ
jgi:hypothetical protein